MFYDVACTNMPCLQMFHDNERKVSHMSRLIKSGLMEPEFTTYNYDLTGQLNATFFLYQFTRIAESRIMALAIEKVASILQFLCSG